MQVSYVNIFVTDLEQAIAFYRDKLGLFLQFSSQDMAMPLSRQVPFDSGSRCQVQITPVW